MCEEIRNASTAVPRSILTSLGINSVLGLGMLVGVLYCLGDIEAAFETPIKYPFMEIFMQATKSRSGSLAMTAIVLSMGMFCQVAVLAAASRMLWAFARDRGVPDWRTLSKVGLMLYSFGPRLSWYWNSSIYHPRLHLKAPFLYLRSLHPPSSHALLPLSTSAPLSQLTMSSPSL